MIKNYLKTAWRSLLKNKFFSTLNILGLAVSLAVAVLLISFARQELSYDTQFSKKDQIYRVIMEANAEYNYEKWSELPNAVGPTMLSDIPEVRSMARLVNLDFTGFGSVRANENNFIEKNIFLTDSSFFSLFDVVFHEGNASTAFRNPKSVVISSTNKQKMFGNAAALDKKLVINQQDTLTITGVFEDLPHQSSFDVGILLNMMDSWMGKNVHWSNASYHTYCLLNEGADPSSIEQKATALIDKYVPKDNQYYTKFFLQPLTKIHLESTGIRDRLAAHPGSMGKVNTVLALAVLIIVIACINYMNLATARSQKNAKEVGVNKVLGAHRNQIKLRFYLETALLSFFAILIGLLLAIMTAPLFNSMLQADIAVRDLLSLENMGISVLIWLVITLLGGSYPAFFMANIPSLSLMKNIVTQSQFAQILRQGLVVFQFTCSIVLIIGVIVISLQMRHVTEKDLGYRPNNILTIPIRSVQTAEKFNTIRQSLANLAGTKSVATVQTFPGFAESGKTMHRPGNLNEGLPTRTSSSRGPVVETLGLQLLAGKDLPNDLAPTDTTSYLLINEVVAAYLGYATPVDAVGQSLPTEIGQSIIVGVIRNFNFESLKAPIGGYVYYRMNRPSEAYRYILAQYDTQDVNSYVAQVEQIFRQQEPEAAFDYQFLDEHIKSFYTQENQTSSVISVFSVLTVLIACLGLFGLAAFTAEQRKKEIGVRKVLGATIYRIIYLLSSRFMVLVLVSLLIASPVAWGVFSRWLQDFNDKIDFPWWSFGLAGLFAIGIALMTVGYQAIRAARANPVDSLRDE